MSNSQTHPEDLHELLCVICSAQEILWFYSGIQNLVAITLILGDTVPKYKLFFCWQDVESRWQWQRGRLGWLLLCSVSRLSGPSPVWLLAWNKCFVHYSSSQDSPTALECASWRLIPSHLLRTACGDAGKYKCCASSNVPNANLETQPLQSPSTISSWFDKHPPLPCASVASGSSPAPLPLGGRAGGMDAWMWWHRHMMVPLFLELHTLESGVGDPSQPNACPWLRLLPQDFLSSASSSPRYSLPKLWSWTP